jgi:hypothetical protein
MTENRLKQKIVEGITCMNCRHFTWVSWINPIFLASNPGCGWHHPSCPVFKPQVKGKKR